MIDNSRKADGTERISRIQQALKDEDLDAVICTLPSFVLMVSGYWPVIGTAVAVATSDGQVAVLAPEDELEFAEHGWAHRVVTFRPSTLDTITTPAIAATNPLRTFLRELRLQCARIGYEYGGTSEPATYSGMNLYGASVIEMLRTAVPSSALAPANLLLARLAASKTKVEIERIRTSCRIAAEAFEWGKSQIREGAEETEVASAFRRGFSVIGMKEKAVMRADGFAWCMSGANAAKAKAAFAYSSARRLREGETILVHSNNYADGYWTDITRNYLLGDQDDRQKRMYRAIAEARAAAFDMIHPGISAAAVDAAARNVLNRFGFRNEFPHSTGHGVGFAAISSNALPRIHPKSDEVLETGMTFNIEPAVYIENYGGARHCDMVAVTANGMELLTDFQNEIA